ncbi:TPA: hypothetical protein N0F65_000539 [Lagenidium giganteum]|uniref:Uncharacterized protein n=1 Tax=Lagenidium giganteum TaxID=4803 RepID=A0AAV2Z2S7_9STRA|nr:TPA: hypothetical protein N0F65_000539 [Lagenidium giganteum]
MEAVIAAANDPTSFSTPLLVELADLDSEVDERQSYRFLQAVLNGAVASHPLYKVGAKSELPATEDVISRPLLWLVHCHLSERLASGTTPTPWKLSSLPQDVVAALDKLILCFKKYRLLLLYFFVWRPARDRHSRATDTASLTRDSLMALLKHARVFPQMFSRRELTNIIVASSCTLPTSPGSTLNFPEFVEVLVRCSLTLQWAEARHAVDEMTTVMRFLMLVFAMEGKGSVLQKRNDDIRLVLQYIDQQQGKQRREKMTRFHRLLASQAESKTSPRSRSSTQRPQTPQQRLRMVFSPTSARREHHSPEFKLVGSASRVNFQASEMPLDYSDASLAMAASVQQPAQPGTGRGHEEHASDATATAIASEVTGTSWVPTTKEEFLDDIITSMGDIELLLHGPSSGMVAPYPASSMAHTAKTSMEPLHKEDQTEEDEWISNYLASLRAERADNDESASLPDELDEIPIQDAALDYLTRTDRFSDSKGQASATGHRKIVTSVTDDDVNRSKRTDASFQHH